MSDTIQAIRSFNRFHSGMLADDATALPGDLSPTEGRILTELAQQDGQTARTIMKALGLDAGYLSRILAGFEKQRFIKRERSRRDRRAVLITLTTRGKALAAEIEAAAQTQIRSRLGAMDAATQQELIAALQRVQALCTPARRTAPLVLRQLKLGDAGWIIHRHGALIAVEHGWDERFEGMCAGILSDFIRQYDARWERSWVAERDGRILGSLFLVRVDEQIAKLRLLYVEKEARGMGLATKLIEKSMQFARSKGYQRLQLFTTSENLAARRIYQRLGFTMIREEAADQFCTGLTGEIWDMPL